MKLGLCQLDCAFEDKAATKRRIARLLRRIPPGKALDWLLFPEMTLTSFSMKPRKTALSREDMSFFIAIAKERSAFVSFGGVRGGRNLLITLDRSGREVSSYAKTHLFTRLKEEDAYTQGSKPETFSLEGARVSPTVCFDLRFAYLYWNLGPKTDIFVNIACWPTRREEHWLTLLRARAIENLCYSVGVNRVGRDPDFEYCGRSGIYDPMGVQVLDCGCKEGVFTADISVESVAETRARLPFLKDRKAWS
ncbi:MAG: carbon-nitrogen family hydrolase [Elusimicrobia bacterium]|nr:carbon-nitrogen family hydrolase [Elusimicrobiota bacterium]